MWLKQLSIQHFRNYQELEIEFHPGLNIFLGQNAQGKTNILESIYFLALTRSHRTRNDKISSTLNPPISKFLVFYKEKLVQFP